MKNNSVIIKLHENRIWFNDTVSIPAENSNLPIGEIRFNRVKEIYWQVEQLAFDKNNQTLEVRVVDYFLRDISPFPDKIQKQKSSRSVLLI